VLIARELIAYRVDVLRALWSWAGTLAIGAVGLAALAGCGPNSDDYPLLRPDAGYPDAALLQEQEDEGQTNFIEDDPLEDWDMTDAGPLSGIFAVQVRISAKVIVEIESRQLLRFRLLQKGAELKLRSQMCRIGLPSVPGVAELEIPLALEMLVRSKDAQHTGDYLSSADPVGADFAPPDVLVVLGAKLTKPATDPLPTADNLSSALDEDDDGQPGISLLAKTVLCAGKEAAYAALRSGATISGKVESYDRIVGSVKPVLDQSVLGFSDPCMAAAADLPIEILPGSEFEAIRVSDALDLNENGNVTCGEIVAAAPQLFGSYWED